MAPSADQLPSAAGNGAPRRRRNLNGPGQETPTGASPGSSNGHAPQPGELKRLPRRKKSRSLARRCKRFALKHTWTIPLVLLLAILSLYAVNPSESNIIYRFIFLSYKQDPLEVSVDPNAPAQYGKGLWDVAFVSFYTIVLSFTREFIMQEMLRPLARFCGIKTRGKQQRFVEQMYTAVYFGLMGPAGIYVMRRSPVWYFNKRGMYEFFPHKTHDAVFKFYYLFQAAYWAQQAIVMLLGLEKRRKDFKELIGHHIVTLALIALSYRFHFTYMGIAVYVTHDISDFFLAVSSHVYVPQRRTGRVLIRDRCHSYLNHSTISTVPVCHFTLARP
jgi:acyl-CoA-dependent ceramide synthase